MTDILSCDQIYFLSIVTNSHGAHFIVLRFQQRPYFRTPLNKDIWRLNIKSEVEGITIGCGQFYFYFPLSNNSQASQIALSFVKL